MSICKHCFSVVIRFGSVFCLFCPKDLDGYLNHINNTFKSRFGATHMTWFIAPLTLSHGISATMMVAATGLSRFVKGWRCEIKHMAGTNGTNDALPSLPKKFQAWILGSFWQWDVWMDVYALDDVIKGKLEKSRVWCWYSYIIDNR